MSHLLWKELSWWVISFYYSNHSSWGYGEAYTILVEDNVPCLKVSIDNLAFRMPEFSGIDKIDEWVYVETFELDQNILKELEKLANKHKIWEWEGSYSNDKVFDGDSWSFSMRFGNGEQVSAYGYMASPTGFREGIKDFLFLFEEKSAQTREKADELLETIGKRQS